jgi:CheY-like chemotaxis protein
MTAEARPDDPSPHGRVLVVEDTFLIAESLAAMLEDLGYGLAGPVPTNAQALDLLETQHVDAALLDVSLRGELVIPVADRLAALGSPFAFLTAHADLTVLPAQYRSVPTIRKPCTPEVLAAWLAETL